MTQLYSRIELASAFIQKRVKKQPKVAILTGTGTSMRSLIGSEYEQIPYAQIPEFPQPSAPGHEGSLYLTEVDNMGLALFSGRFHAYEGLTLEDVTFPVRVMKAIGVEILIVLNASGSVSEAHPGGSLAVLTDHINFMQVNPLIGPNDDRLGPRFPDMSQVYDEDLRNLAHQESKKLEIALKDAIYLALRGPSLETSAEYRMVSRLGADLVGMSTVPEVIVARHAGLRVLALSVVSNQFDEDDPGKTTIEEVIAVVQRVEPALEELVKNIVLDISSSKPS